jgi:hypothetical protein
MRRTGEEQGTRWLCLVGAQQAGRPLTTVSQTGGTVLDSGARAGHPKDPDLILLTRMLTTGMDDLGWTRN